MIKLFRIKCNFGENNITNANNKLNGQIIDYHAIYLCLFSLVINLNIYYNNYGYVYNSNNSPLCI